MGLTTAIGLGLAGASSFLGAKSANKNAKRAAQVSQDNNQQNVALQRDIFQQNQQTLSPFVQRGNAAGDTLNALLGLGGSQPAQQQQVQPNALSQFRPTGAGSGFGIGDLQAGLSGPAQVQSGPQVSPQQAANDAFDTFRNSTGFQFRLGEGMDALNSGFAGAGVLQSGDAVREAIKFGQNFASNEFGNFANLLANQQGVGLSGANALAGVGTNFANNVSNQNTINAANQANALTARQNPLANLGGLIGGGLFGFGTNAIGSGSTGVGGFNLGGGF